MNRLLLLAALLLALTGCSRPPGPTELEQNRDLWRAWQQQAAAVDSWNLHARAAITREAEAYQVGIRWRRDNEESMLLLEAPFGQGVFRIESSAAGGWHRLRLPDGQEFVDETPEALLEQVIGWSLPISGLEFWIRGLPHPDSAYGHKADASGRARSISQDRWEIEYLDYFADPSRPLLPRRIRLAHDELSLKLVIERWRQAEIDPAPSDLFPEFN